MRRRRPKPSRPAAQLSATTWSEDFPIGETVTVEDQSTMLDITTGGTATGYKLYTPAPGGHATISGGQFNLRVSAPYVIIRGLTLSGAEQDAIRLYAGAHHVVIENNDISGWGRSRSGGGEGWTLGVDMDSGIRCASIDGAAEHVAEMIDVTNLVVQRNRIHDPRYGANSWTFGHPAGPQGITFSYCGGNHVIRYNEITSSLGHYYNDPIGGEDNFTATGFPNHDSDIYGNIIENSWDDGIESEGGNRNVRIWNNYLDHTATGIASTVTHVGPLYIFRNVYNRCRFYSDGSADDDGWDRGPFAKSYSQNDVCGPDVDGNPCGHGRRYLFHNTLLQATEPGATYPLGAGMAISGSGTQPLTDTVTRNNIFHIWKAVDEFGSGPNNDFEYDLYNGNVDSPYEQQHGLDGTPVYASGHGWQSESGGLYQLDPSSPGYDVGLRLANFNDDFRGVGPDMGAAESGDPKMLFGVNASEPATTTEGNGGSDGGGSDGDASYAGSSGGGSDGGGGHAATADGGIKAPPDGAGSAENSDSGCGCRVGAGGIAVAAWAPFASLALLGLFMRRRRRATERN